MPRIKENLRRGFTTGACAAAAAAAAAQALLTRATVTSVPLTLEGEEHTFAVAKCSRDASGATCSVFKDAGDDPDVTDGAELVAHAAWLDAPGFMLEAGEGVGRVTRPGLEIPVGEAAINPVPRAMIEAAVREFVDTERRGITVTISVPRGEKLARRTLNGRLGIIGGISILGTSGRVTPFAASAFTASIELGLKVALAADQRQIVLTTGRRSEKYAQAELGLPEICYLQVGDYVGFTLDAATRHGIDRVCVWGMVGKLSKLAAGVFETHVNQSRVDIMFMAEVAAASGVPENSLAALRETVTARHFQNTLPPEVRRLFTDRLCALAAAHCRDRTGGACAVSVILSDYHGQVLGRGDVV